MEITSVGLFVWITDHFYFLASAEIKNLVMHVIIYQSNFAAAAFVPTTLRKLIGSGNNKQTNVLLIYSTSTEVQLQFCFIKHKIIVKQITFSNWKTCLFKCLHARFMFCIRFYSSDLYVPFTSVNMEFTLKHLKAQIEQKYAIWW